MYNTNLPTRAELPSSKQLLRSTLIAAGVAGLLLITVVLPAEYGVDPTGAGRYLGLTEMGDIKTSLAAEADAETAGQPAPVPAVVAVAAAQPSAPAAVPAAITVAPTIPKQAALAATPFATEFKVFTLKPGQAAEIKLGMKKSAKVNYQWSVEGGTVNFDTHGDSATLNYYGYGKGRQVTGDQGVLEAAFDGKHGWFWRNRSNADVTISLSTQGDFQSFDRMI